MVLRRHVSGVSHNKEFFKPVTFQGRVILLQRGRKMKRETAGVLGKCGKGILICPT
jgi:hypothetical protein